MSSIRQYPTTPFNDQRPGTSGLRKKVSVFQQPHYLENFLQSIFSCVPELTEGRLVIGGDGRYYNKEALQTTLKMASAAGIKQIYLAQDGLLSTPAASLAIRHYQAQGGILLTASHNPAGPQGDFGVKFNCAHGGAAPKSLTEKIYNFSQNLESYKIFEHEDVNLGATEPFLLGGMEVIPFDPVSLYASLMEKIFDFDAIRALFKTGFSFRFDALHAITGPYAKLLFEEMLEAPQGTVVNAVPKEDFNGQHPDPTPTHAQDLVHAVLYGGGLNFGAASDGDGDRNLILGPNLYINPCDSLAILTENASLVPAYKQGVKGIGRSITVTRAVDLVAKDLEIPTYITPVGWKYFADLLEAEKITLCGEESNGTGSDHIREKDGLWAVLFWLNILAVRQESVQSIMEQHWNKFGRFYFSRHDFEELSTSKAQNIMGSLQKNLSLPIEKVTQALHETNLKLLKSEEFTYTDLKGNLHKEGLCFQFNQGRLTFRLSGTGTSGATLRVYMELHDKKDFFADPQEKLVPLIKVYRKLTGLDQLGLSPTMSS